MTDEQRKTQIESIRGIISDLTYKLSQEQTALNVLIEQCPHKLYRRDEDYFICNTCGDAA